MLRRLFLSFNRSSKNNPALSTAGADLRVCPYFGARRDSGADTQACPYRDHRKILIYASEAAGNFSANCTVCESPPLNHYRKLRKPDRSHLSFTRSVKEAAQTGQLKFLHKLCPPESHRRKPVDCSVPSYRGHERSSAIPPAAAGGSFSPNLCFPLLDARAGIERSTGFRRWDSRAFLAPCRPGLNDPPASAGGIHKASTCVETLAGQFALRLSHVLLFFALLCSALPAEAQSGDQQLRWGGDAEGGAPYLLPDPKNPREIIGFEVDLMNAVGKQLNRKSVFVQNQWDGLIPGLQRGNYDLAVNGIEITDDRKQQVNFSIPYYACGEQLSVRAGENSINSLADLKGKAVGTLKASLAQRILEREGGIEVRSYENQNNAYDDLALGRLQAVLMDWPIAVYYSKPNPKLKFVGPIIERMEYGIAARKEDMELLKQVNDALLALIKSGELRRIYEKWGIWNGETEQLFARISSAPQSGQVYDEFTQNITKKLTWRERLTRYKSYLPPLLLIGAPMTLLNSV